MWLPSSSKLNARKNPSHTNNTRPWVLRALPRRKSLLSVERVGRSILTKSVSLGLQISFRRTWRLLPWSVSRRLSTGHWGDVGEDNLVGDGGIALMASCCPQFGGAFVQIGGGSVHQCCVGLVLPAVKCLDHRDWSEARQPWPWLLTQDRGER